MRSFKKPALKVGVAKLENIEVNTIENFIKVAETIDLTEPQKDIIQQYKRGYKLKTINMHHASGGYYVWEDKNGEEHYAGTVYKAFWNIVWKIERLYGDFSAAFLQGESR